MKSTIILLSVVMSVVMPLRAQENFDRDSIYYSPITKPFSFTNSPAKRFGYFFSLSSSALVGCTDCSYNKEITFSTTAINGATIGKKLRVGAGVGYDAYYFWQSTPFSGVVSWDVLGNKDRNALFVQVSYGWSKVWSNGYEEYGLTKIDGGKTATTQIGYRIRYHDVKIALSIGTKFQEVTSFYEYPTYYYLYTWQAIQGTSSTKTVEEKLNRLQLSLTVGWR